MKQNSRVSGGGERGREGEEGGRDLQCARRRLRRNFLELLPRPPRRRPVRVCVLYQCQLRTGNTLGGIGNWPSWITPVTDTSSYYGVFLKRSSLKG